MNPLILITAALTFATFTSEERRQLFINDFVDFHADGLATIPAEWIPALLQDWCEEMIDGMEECIDEIDSDLFNDAHMAAWHAWHYARSMKEQAHG